MSTVSTRFQSANLPTKTTILSQPAAGTGAAAVDEPSYGLVVRPPSTSSRLLSVRRKMNWLTPFGLRMMGEMILLS